MKVIILIFNWLAGLFSLLLGLLMLLAGLGEPIFFAVALPWFIIALLLLPPSRFYFYAKTFKKISPLIRILLVIMLMGTSGFLVPTKQDYLAGTNSPEQSAEQEKSRIEQFKQDKTQILAQIHEDFEKKNFDAALATTTRYLVTGDKELIELDLTIRLVKEQHLNANQIAQIKESIKTTAKNDYVVLRDLYNKLWNYYPTNANYAEKVKVLTQKAEKVTQKKQQKQAKQDNRKKTEKILKVLKSVPISDHQLNHQLYSKLVELNPDNKKYIEKRDFYQKKINQGAQ